ncbi:MAG TPA: DNA ligase D, partial [Pirellulales bacterium]|nr:DNA ligase D [Pirellulales bacterium]
GEKLRGGWALVRMGGRRPDKKVNWLLIKERDDTARPLEEYDVVEARPESVLSRRTIEQIAAEGDGGASKQLSTKQRSTKRRSTKRRVDDVEQASSLASSRAGKKPRAKKSSARSVSRRKSASARKTNKEGRAAPMPRNCELQLATLAKSPPEGDGWLHEIKLDGYRLLCRISKGKVTFITRGEQDWTRRFGSLAEAAERLPVKSAILDGEAVALLPSGVSSFQALQNAFRGEQTAPLLYYAFDLLYLDGRDLRPLPLERRKEILAELLAGADEGPLRLSEHIVGQGAKFFEQLCRRGLEGAISKRRDRPYLGGRGGDWIKTKCIQRAEFVIGGFTDPERSREGFGALLVGYHDDKRELTYAGRVGTGFSAKLLRELRQRLEKRVQRKSPFQKVPRRDMTSGTHWVKPELVAQVEFTNWTDDGILRHPSFQGLREDKAAREITRELPRNGRPEHGSAKKALKKPTTARGRPPADASRRPAPSNETAELAGVKLTHANRLLYPDQGITKLGLATYYTGIADWILPHVAGRPLSLLRCPEGLHKTCFYQKHVGPGTPQAIRRVPIEEHRRKVDYAMVEDVAGLVALVQMGILEIHPWGARADNVERPDRLIFDLDPGPETTWRAVIGAARRLRALLEELDLASFVKTTGGKGLHVVLPLQRRHAWPLAKAFSKAVAQRLANESPELYLINPSRKLRVGKIFIDYLRNDRGATAVAPYSTRARVGAPISAPIAWDKLSERLRPDQFNVEALPEWIGSLRRDPWREMGAVRQTITSAHRKELRLG